MFQGNWKCSSCGGAITELPFEPRSESGLTCRECYFKEKDRNNVAAASAPESSGEIDDRDVPDFDPGMTGAASEPAPESPDIAEAPAASGERKMFEGKWQCADCGGSIASLPFEPRSTENLRCLDCFKQSKAA